MSLVSIIAILFVWTIFANPIPIDVKDFPYVCYKIENVEIDNYKVIIEYGVYNRNSLQSALDQREREVYEATKNECIKCSNGRSSKVYLLDKNTDITEITHENLEDKAIFIWEIYDSDCTSLYDIIKIYKINNNLGSYEIVQSNIKNLGKIRKFCLFWLFAVIIETLVLFIIAKIFRKFLTKD